MPVAWRTASTNVQGNAAHAVAVPPTGTVAGDLLIAVHVSDFDGNLAAMTAPTGWTLTSSRAGSASRENHVKIWQRTATSSEPTNYTFQDSTGANAAVGILRIDGHDPNATLTVTWAAGAASTSHNAPSVTGVVGGLLVTIHTADTNGTVRSYTKGASMPAAWTERVDIAQASSAYNVLGIFTEDLTSTAATGIRTATCSGSVRYVAASLVISPSSVSAPTVNAGTDVTGHAVNTAFTRTATENANGGTITSRAWTIQAGPAGQGSTIGTAAALSWTPTTAGTYTLRYSATSSAGTGTDDMTIEVVAGSGAITIREVVTGTAYSGTSSSVTVNTTQAQVGDLLVLFFGTDYSQAGLDHVAPTGSAGTWTRRTAAQTVTNSDANVTVWTRPVTATTNAVTVTSNGIDASVYAHLHVITGHDTTNPVDGGAATIVAAASGTSWTAPSVTGSSGGLLLCGWQSQYQNVNPPDIPASMNTAVTTVNNSGQGVLRTARETLTSSGATGTRVATGANDLHATATIAIKPAPAASAPTVGAGTDVASHYANTEFARTATESANGSTITARAWTIQAGPAGQGTTIGTAAALAWTPTVTGAYTLRYSATNANGTGFDDMSITVVAQAAPTVGVGADVASHTVSTAFTRTATESANGSAITSRAWTISSGPAGQGTTIGTAAALSWTPTTVGTYTLQYAATNGVGTGTDTLSITVTSGPPPTVGAGTDVASHAVDTEFTRTATATGSGITAYEWKIQSGPFGAGTVLSTTTALSWFPNLAGTYVLRFSATNAGGTATDDMSITVVNPPATPGQILNIGIGAGKNHFSVDIARPTVRELIECEQIEAGHEEVPYFTGTADYSRCSFWTSVDAATTSGSSYPRSELREVDPGGSVNAAWDPHDNGTHWIRGRSAATHLMEVKPTLIMAQQHSGADDVIQVRTRLVSGAIQLEIVLNGDSANAIVLARPYAEGTEYDWMLEILPSLNGQPAKGRIYYNSWLVPAHTWLASSMPATTPGHYYKAGNYLNSNTSTENGDDTEYGSSTLRNLQHWHTGWAAPDNGFWGLPEVDAGTDFSSPAGWSINRTGIDGALEANRVWYVVDGPTNGTDVGQFISDNATLSWSPMVQGTYRLRYGVTTDVGTNYDDILVTVTAPVSAGGGFLPFFDS